MGKIFNKGLDKDDQAEGLVKRLKNIANTQKRLINGNNEPDTARSISSLSSISDSISSKSKDKDKDKKLSVNFIKMEELRVWKVLYYLVI